MGIYLGRNDSSTLGEETSLSRNRRGLRDERIKIIRMPHRLSYFKNSSIIFITVDKFTTSHQKLMRFIPVVTFTNSYQ